MNSRNMIRADEQVNFLHADIKALIIRVAFVMCGGSFYKRTFSE
jgi:hypothetical protein